MEKLNLTLEEMIHEINSLSDEIYEDDFIRLFGEKYEDQVLVYNVEDEEPMNYLFAHIKNGIAVIPFYYEGDDFNPTTILINPSLIRMMNEQDMESINIIQERAKKEVEVTSFLLGK